jgi:hypothetical protein
MRISGNRQNRGIGGKFQGFGNRGRRQNQHSGKIGVGSGIGRGILEKISVENQNFFPKLPPFLIVDHYCLAAAKIAKLLVRFVQTVVFAVADSVFENLLSGIRTRDELVAAILGATVLLASLNNVERRRTNPLRPNRLAGFAVRDCRKIVDFRLARKIPRTIMHHRIQLVIVVCIQPRFFDEQLK